MRVEQDSFRNSQRLGLVVLVLAAAAGTLTAGGCGGEDAPPPPPAPTLVAPPQPGVVSPGQPGQVTPPVPGQLPVQGQLPTQAAPAGGDPTAALDQLGAFEARFRKQLALKFGELPIGEATKSSPKSRSQRLRENRALEIEQLFEDWSSWYERTRKMVNDPNPYVEIKAVFVG